MDDRARASHREREHFFGAAKVVAGVTFLSRLFGMFRDMAFLGLGATRLTGAFIVAFQFPNLFRALFGEGAMSSAFVPMLTDAQEKSGPAKAAKFFANALGLLAVVLLALLVLILAGLAVWHTFWPGPWDRRFLVMLIAIMMPFMVTVCLQALGAAALNCRGHFAYPAFAPILLNIFMIAAVWVGQKTFNLNDQMQFTVLAWTVVLAGVVQLAAVLWLVHRIGFAIMPRLRPVEEGIGRMAKMLLPILLGTGFMQFSPLLGNVVLWMFSTATDTPSASCPLTQGAQAQVYAAQRLYQFPMGILAASLAVAVFPLLSRYIARGDHVNFRDSVNRALRLAFMEGVASGTGLLVLARPVTDLIWRHRKFLPADVDGAAFILQMYVLGMWSYCMYPVLTRAFYANKQPKTPMTSSAILMPVNVALLASLIWVPWLRAGAAGLATAITFSINTFILAVILRKRMGRFGGMKLLRSALRSTLAAGAMAAAVLALRYYALPGRSSWLVVAVCLPAGAAVFFAVATALRSPELGELFGALRKPKPQPAEHPAPDPQTITEIESEE